MNESWIITENLLRYVLEGHIVYMSKLQLWYRLWDHKNPLHPDAVDRYLQQMGD